MNYIYFLLVISGFFISFWSIIKKVKGAIPLALFWINILAIYVLMSRRESGLVLPESVVLYGGAFVFLSIAFFVIWFVSVYIKKEHDNKAFMNWWLVIFIIMLIATISTLMNLLEKGEYWGMFNRYTIAYYISSVSLLISINIVSVYLQMLKLKIDNQNE